MEREAARRKREEQRDIDNAGAVSGPPRLAFGKILQSSLSSAHNSETEEDRESDRKGNGNHEGNDNHKHVVEPLQRRGRQTVVGDDKFRVRMFPR